jgi:hypothetical protein
MKLSHKNKKTKKTKAPEPTDAFYGLKPSRDDGRLAGQRVDGALLNGGQVKKAGVPIPQVGSSLPVQTPDFGPLIGPPRPWIVAPAHNNMLTTVYVRSVFAYAQMYFAQFGQWPVVDWIGQESCVPRARNNFVRRALLHPTPPTHIAFIDTDIEFNPQDLHDMLCSGLSIVVGGYPKKAYDFEKAFAAMQAGGISSAAELELVGTDPVTNFFEDHMVTRSIPYLPQRDGNNQPTGKKFMVCKEAGCGFMAIRIEVLRHMVKSYPERRYICNDNSGPGQETFNLFSNEVDPFPHDSANPQFITEDYNFSRLAQRVGIPTFVYDSPVLGHMGNFTYKAQLSRAFTSAQAGTLTPGTAILPPTAPDSPMS